MSEYTPTLESVRELAVWAAIQHLPEDMRTAEALDDARRRFGRTIAEVERAAAEKALAAAADAVGDPRFKDDQNTATLGEIKRWLRECAASYRRNEGENDGNRP